MHGRIQAVCLVGLILLLGLGVWSIAQPQYGVSAQGFPTPTPVPSDTPGVSTPTDTPTSIIPTMTPSSTGVLPSDTPGGPTATPGGTAQATNTPRPRGAPATPSTGIRLNRCAQVVGPQGINLGQGPGFNFGHIQIVGRDDIVYVLEGPERGDDLWWWKVRTRDGVEGWGINDHLLPYSGACFVETTQVVIGPTVLPAQLGGASGSTAQSSGGELPATGTNAGGVIAAGVLAVVLVVVGLLRRRNQNSA